MRIEFGINKPAADPIVFTEGRVYMLKKATSCKNIFLCARLKEGKRLIDLYDGGIWSSNSCSGMAGDDAFEDITNRVKLVGNK